ncbi:MAG TPA: NAD-dependent epimerase/dehydratase family protein [Spirochaetia bacterium]|nr:NAD-dependent epimerase/dehydratase family protein [Spirochaetia bacterium]
MTTKETNETGAGSRTDGRLAVMFGAGPVGTAAALRLREKGVTVRVVTRSGRIPAELIGKVESTTADATDRTAVLRTARGADFIIHCANVPYELWKSVLPPIQRNLIDAAVENGALFAASENLYMYAPPTGPICENSPIDPPTRKGRLRAALHDLLPVAQTERGLKWVTIRASDYYGPGAADQSHFGFRFLDPLFKGKKPALLGDPEQPHSFAYVDDYGRAIADAALDPSAHNRTWIAPHDRPIIRREFAQMFFRAAGKTGKISRIPNVLLSTVGFFVPMIREVKEMLYQFEMPFTVDDSEYRRHFHAEPVPLEEGVRRTIEWYLARDGKY